MNGGTVAGAVPHFAGAAMLLLGLLLPLRAPHAAAARLVAWQGGFLTLAAAAVAWGGGGARFWLLALGALVARAVAVPMLLRLASAGRSGVAAALPPGAGALLLAGGGLAVLAAAAVLPAGGGAETGAREGLALALAVLLAGLLAMAGRRGALPKLLGLVAAENGALLGLVHAGGAPGAAAALLALSPGVVACAALAVRRVRAEAESTATTEAAPR